MMILYIDESSSFKHNTDSTGQLCTIYFDIHYIFSIPVELVVAAV